MTTRTLVTRVASLLRSARWAASFHSTCARRTTWSPRRRCRLDGVEVDRHINARNTQAALLEELSLARTGLNATGAVVVAVGARRSRYVHRLDVSGNAVGAAGAILASLALDENGIVQW